VQKPQYDLCCEVLRRLREHRVLQHLVLTGSWCLLLYCQYFERDELFSTLRTRDMDFLVPVPLSFREKVDIPALLEDLGFLTEYKGAAGYMQLMHPEVMLEFLVPMHGRGNDQPFDLPPLGLNAQRLRYMDIALMRPIRLTFEDVPVRVPRPACFALHKLLVAPRRKEAARRERDVAVAAELLSLLFERKEAPVLKEIFGQFPASWRKTACKVVHDFEQESLRVRLMDLNP
jgi:hypothetical protein